MGKNKETGRNTGRKNQDSDGWTKVERRCRRGGSLRSLPQPVASTAQPERRVHERRYARSLLQDAPSRSLQRIRSGRTFALQHSDLAQTIGAYILGDSRRLVRGVGHSLTPSLTWIPGRSRTAIQQAAPRTSAARSAARSYASVVAGETRRLRDVDEEENNDGVATHASAATRPLPHHIAAHVPRSASPSSSESEESVDWAIPTEYMRPGLGLRRVPSNRGIPWQPWVAPAAVHARMSRSRSCDSLSRHDVAGMVGNRWWRASSRWLPARRSTSASRDYLPFERVAASSPPVATPRLDLARGCYYHPFTRLVTSSPVVSQRVEIPTPRPYRPFGRAFASPAGAAFVSQANAAKVLKKSANFRCASSHLRVSPPQPAAQNLENTPGSQQQAFSNPSATTLAAIVRRLEASVNEDFDNLGNGYPEELDLDVEISPIPHYEPSPRPAISALAAAAQRLDIASSQDYNNFSRLAAYYQAASTQRLQIRASPYSQTDTHRFVPAPSVAPLHAVSPPLQGLESEENCSAFPSSPSGHQHLHPAGPIVASPETNTQNFGIPVIQIMSPSPPFIAHEGAHARSFYSPLAVICPPITSAPNLKISANLDGNNIVLDFPIFSAIAVHPQSDVNSLYYQPIANLSAFSALFAGKPCTANDCLCYSRFTFFSPANTSQQPRNITDLHGYLSERILTASSAVEQCTCNSCHRDLQSCSFFSVPSSAAAAQQPIDDPGSCLFTTPSAAVQEVIADHQSDFQLATTSAETAVQQLIHGSEHNDSFFTDPSAMVEAHHSTADLNNGDFQSNSQFTSSSSDTLVEEPTNDSEHNEASCITSAHAAAAVQPPTDESCHHQTQSYSRFTSSSAETVVQKPMLESCHRYFSRFTTPSNAEPVQWRVDENPRSYARSAGSSGETIIPQIPDDSDHRDNSSDFTTPTASTAQKPLDDSHHRDHQAHPRSTVSSAPTGEPADASARRDYRTISKHHYASSSATTCAQRFDATVRRANLTSALQDDASRLAAPPSEGSPGVRHQGRDLNEQTAILDSDPSHFFYSGHRLSRPKNRMVVKSQSCTSVYYEPILGEHLCDPHLVEIFLERRREQCLELLEECVVLFGDKIVYQYETVRDCLVDLMDDLRDGYDAVYMFPGEEASRQLQRLSPPPCSPLDELFFRTYNKLQESSRLLFLIYEHVWDFYSSVSNRRPQDIPYNTPLEAANNQPWLLLNISLQVAEMAKLLEFYQEVKERDLLMQSLLYDYGIKNKQWIFKRNKCKTS